MLQQFVELPSGINLDLKRVVAYEVITVSDKKENSQPCSLLNTHLTEDSVVLVIEGTPEPWVFDKEDSVFMRDIIQLVFKKQYEAAMRDLAATGFDASTASSEIIDGMGV